MRTASPHRGSSRFTVFPLAAVLALCGCHSGGGGAPTNQNPPTGYAYVASASATPGGAGTVYEYAVRSDGALTPLAQASIAAGINPSALVVVGNGEYVYVVNAGDGSISQYSVAADATLTALSPATVANPGMHTLGSTGAAALVNPGGGYLYVVNTADDNVAQFSIGIDGQLTSLTPSTVATDVAPISIAAGLNADSKSVYVLNAGPSGGAGSVSQYTRAVDGTLTPANSTPLAAGTSPSLLAINTASTVAYVFSDCAGTQCQGSIQPFTLGADGALTATGGNVTTGSHYRGVGMSFQQDVAASSGYVLSNALGVDTESGTLWSFQAADSGALTATSPPSQDVSGAAVALVQNFQDGTLYVLTSNSGALANTPATGGGLSIYALGIGDTPTLEGTTTLSAPYPTALGVWALLPP